MDAERVSSVLMSADTVGGVWTYAVELARALSREGVRVHLATMGAPLRDAQRRQVGGIAALSLHESSFALEWMRDPWDEVDRAGQWLLALEAELRPRVLHLNQYAFGALPFRAPKLLVAHSCVLSWWRAVHGAAAPPEWNTYRRRVSDGLAGAQQVVAPTRAMLASLAADYGWRGSGAVLPNARDPQLFQPAPKQDFIFAAGRFWDEGKNLAALDAAAGGLTWPVRAAGSFVGPDGISSRPRHVQALGELPASAIAAQMAHAAIYALPAHYEPFGLSGLEAALSGCALVLGDLASLRETWGTSALYVPPDDPAALRTTLQHLIGDAGERTRLGQAARQRALHFDPGRMARAYLRCYGAIRQREPACA